MGFGEIIVKEGVYRKNCVKFKNKPSYDKIKKS